MHSEETPDWQSQRNKIIGLGESSIRKSYYHELQQKMAELEKKNEDLKAAYEDLSSNEEELRQNYEDLAHSEQRTRESERRFADIISFLPDATFVIDKNGVILAWNRAMEEMTGVPAEQMIGKGNYEYALPFYHERRPIVIDLVIHDDPAVAADYPVIKNEGRTRITEIFIPHFNNGVGAHLWLTASPLYDADGHLTGAIESIRDITGQKHAEDKIKAALDEKVLLLREIHHRVNNNLQIIISLVNLQMRQIDDERLKQVMA
ncbi:MAG: PAS domain S-box protein, partial [Methanoregula sp.]|nr:PAS domain S-box protein [Methanoregula sp.]